MTYPIVTTRSFSPPERPHVRIGNIQLPLRGARTRRADELPNVPAGHVAVIQLPDEYRILQEQWDLRDESLLRALSVTVVDLRDYMSELRLTYPGRTGADKFTLIISFTCRVSDPKAVAERGGRRVEDYLANYFRANSELGNLASRYESSAMGDLRRKLSAEVQAFAHLSPIDIPGIEVTIGGLDVLTPEELQKHDTEVREQQRAHLLRRERTAFEREEARLMNEFIAGDPDEAARKIGLLGVQHGAVGMEDIIGIQQQLARESREAVRAEQDLRVQFATALVQRGFFDRTSDAMELVQQLWDGGVPSGPLASGRRSETERPLDSGADAKSRSRQAIEPEPGRSEGSDYGPDDSAYESKEL